MKALAHVAYRFLLQVHRSAAIEREPKGEHPVVRVFRHDIVDGPELDLHQVVLVEEWNGSRSFEEDPGPHRDLLRVVLFPA